MARWLPVVLIAIATAATLVIYPQLPDPMPTHWNVRGEVDGWSSRPVGAFLLPAMTLGLLLLLRVLPRIDPRRQNYARFQGAYDTVVLAVTITMLGIHGVVLATSLGYDAAVHRLVPIAVGVLLVVVGNVLPRARPNWFFGIRTPWTLSSDRVWERTHRVGGVLVVLSGILIAATVFLPGAAGLAVMIAVPTLLAFWAFGYSYMLWSRERGRPG